MKIISIIFSILLTFNLSAQNIEAKKFKWMKNPELHNLSNKENDEDEIHILKSEKFEFASDGNKFYNYYFYHQITRVNSDVAIKNNNRVYIPTGRVVEVIATKARVINSKGEVIELDEDDIKVAEDDESRRSYNYFALEGIDIGSEIEFYYILKKTATFTGTRVFLQSDIPTKKLKFSVVCPKHLKFIFKSYNGFEELKEDNSINGKNRWYATAYNIKGLVDEKMSAYKANLQSVVFKLENNTLNDVNELYTYMKAAEYFNTSIRVPLKTKTIKTLDKLLEVSNAKTAKDDFQKIRNLENYIKTHFSYTNSNSSNFETLVTY